MKPLYLFFVLIMAFFGQYLWAASVEVALGPVVKEQQSQAGSYWVQLVAVKKAEAVDRVKKENPQLNIAFHTDKNGLIRVLAGPYANDKEADVAKSKMGKSKAFVRFIKDNPEIQKAQQPQQAQQPKVVKQASANPVKSFIEGEKQDCAKAATQPSAGNEDCPCCLHIRNNTLIRH